MIVKVLRLVFLFIIRIRFPKGKSIADIIRSRYGEAFVRTICKFEKSDYKLRKGHLDLRVLLGCKKSNVIRKFLQFKLANSHLQGINFVFLLIVHNLSVRKAFFTFNLKIFTIYSYLGFQYLKYCLKEKTLTTQKMSYKDVVERALSNGYPISFIKLKLHSLNFMPVCC